MRRPLVIVALLFIAGILLAQIPVPIPALYAIAGLLLGIFVCWKPAQRISLLLLIVLAGWINLAQRAGIISPDDLRKIASGDEQWVRVRGRLRETPYHRQHFINGEEIWSSMARVELDEISIEGNPWRPAKGEIISGTREFLPDRFFAGQTVEISGLLHLPRGPVAQDLFDYRKFLANQGIYHQLDVKHVDDWRILSSPDEPPLADRFCAWARKSLALGLPKEDEALHLEWALTLGWKAGLTAEVSEPFIRASTYHIFAVDGLRIAIISGILFFLLRIARVPRALTGLVIMPVILFYAGMTGWPASAIRAIVMAGVIFFGFLVNRPSDLVNSLFAAALIILVWEPRQLFQAGFQLSFFVVLCIVLTAPIFKSVGEAIQARDKFLPESLKPGWRRFLDEPLRWLIDLFLSSLSAWLGSVPLAAWYFHIFTPLSGPANLLAVPLCALVLICNLASLMFAGWLPAMAIIFNHAGWTFMQAIQQTSNWSAHLPGAYFYVPTPGLYTVVLYYIILLILLTGWLTSKNFRRWKLSAIASLIIVWCGLWIWERPVMKVTVLPLNGGHSIYIAGGDNLNDWLINCGNDSAVEYATKPFLQAQGVNHLYNFLLTHGEMNYTGGAESILLNFPPRHLYLSPVRFRSPSYRQFKDLIIHRSSLQPPIEAGDQVSPWQVLYPPPQTNFAGADDDRLVLAGNFRGVQLLLLADLGQHGQNALLALTNQLKADIVITGMPGDTEPLNESLLDQIQPKAVVIADSAFPANKRAGIKLRERLFKRRIPIFYTSLTDAITIEIRSGKFTISGMDGSRAENVVNENR